MYASCWSGLRRHFDRELAVGRQIDPEIAQVEHHGAVEHVAEDQGGHAGEFADVRPHGLRLAALPVRGDRPVRPLLAEVRHLVQPVRPGEPGLVVIGPCAPEVGRGPVQQVEQAAGTPAHQRGRERERPLAHVVELRQHHALPGVAPLELVQLVQDHEVERPGVPTGEVAREGEDAAGTAPEAMLLHEPFAAPGTRPRDAGEILSGPGPHRASACRLVRGRRVVQHHTAARAREANGRGAIGLGLEQRRRVRAADDRDAPRHGDGRRRAGAEIGRPRGVPPRRAEFGLVAGEQHKHRTERRMRVRHDGGDITDPQQIERARAADGALDFAPPLRHEMRRADDQHARRMQQRGRGQRGHRFAGARLGHEKAGLRRLEMMGQGFGGVILGAERLAQQAGDFRVAQGSGQVVDRGHAPEDLARQVLLVGREERFERVRQSRAGCGCRRWHG